MQPWQVHRVSALKWAIGIDPERRLPAIDPEDREAVLAVGAFLENAVQGAAHLGYDAQMEVIDSAHGGAELARVELRHRSSRGRAPIEPVEQRVTVRADYAPARLRPGDAAWIRAFPGVSYHAPSDRQSALLDEAILSAASEQVRRDAAQAELARLIHWDEAEAERERDGYTVASLGLSGMAAFYARRFMDEESVMQSSFRQRTIDRLKELVERKGGWLVVTGRDDSRASLLDAGRKMERVFVGLRQRAIAMQPLAPALEEGNYRADLERQLGVEGRLQLVARVGYVDSFPDPVSLRRPVHDIIAAPRGASRA